MSFSEQEIEEFKIEAFELLDVAEKSLLAFDAGSEFRPIFDAVFRSFHNLKGAAGMMEMTRLQAHTHELESVWMPFKDEPTLPKNYVSYFLRGIDSARNILNGQEVEFDYSSYKTSGESPIAVAADSAVDSADYSSNSTASAPVATSAGVVNSDNPALIEFFAEADEILVRIDKNLQLLEEAHSSTQTIDELYRDVHSIKGTSFLFGFNRVGDIAHAMESAMEPVRNGTHSSSALLIDGLYKAIEALELEIQCIKKGVSTEPMGEIVATISKLLSVASSELPKSGSAASTIESATVAPVPTVAQVAPTPPVAPAPPVALVASSATVTTSDKKPIAESGTMDQNKKPQSPAASESKESDLGSSIRVPVSLLDNLMTLMGEMVLVRNQVLQFSNSSEDLEFLNLSQRLNVVTNEIQGEMMKTRMQPIGNIMTKFHRVVRDLGHDLNKNISFVLEGAETELDKSLLEAIKDPLTHIIRNSCDHGLETSDVRKKAGKPETGTISVRSFHEGGQVVIEIRDDGKGLNRDALVAKAIERGMITQVQAGQMSEKEIFNLIFAPGFSTAQKVTNVSGRGVGMDVVRTNIEKIGGTVDLMSQSGVGTTIRLKIPLTLAIVPALIVRAGPGNFAIPQVKLVELVRVDQNSSDHRIERLQGAPVYRLRGQILPLLDLNEILRQEPNPQRESGIVNIAVLNADNYCFGLIVDEIQDTADIVVKPLSRLFKSLHVYSGATILGDGSVALILDVLGIAKVAQIRSDNGESASTGSAGLAAGHRSALADNQDFLLVRVGSPTKHAIVLGYVHRLEEFQQSQIDVSGANRVVRYRNAILPIVSANQQLGLPAKHYGPDETVSVVVIERGGHLYGIEVDEILDTLTTDVELDRSLNQENCIIGNLPTEQELIVVTDPFEMISKALNKKVSPLISMAPVPATAQGIRIDGGKDILLVEDTAFFRRIVKDVLEKAGYSVTLAGDGLEAIEVLKRKEGTFSVIVSDIEMPRMNGFEFAKAVRTNATHKDTPLLALSSRFDQAYTQEASKVGYNLYLEKMKPEVLLEAVVNLMKARGAA